jgi:hypothetical protein
VPKQLILGRNNEEHAIVFAPEAVLLELPAEGGLGENAAGKELASIVDINVIRVELIQVSFPHGTQGDRLASEHDILLSNLLFPPA